MRFEIKGPLKENIYNLMRNINYHFLGTDERTGELNFIHPIAGAYPRFHVYLKIDGQNVIFNLHLDQKRPVYDGATAHSGEYEGELVEKEAERIKNSFFH
ncbi:MAG: hypothetical protein PHF44_00680 [Candidatus Pacebacteria bacterium]|nr:hypothetical protein [Candidatus Paceibacterota bacterium]